MFRLVILLMMVIVSRSSIADSNLPDANELRHMKSAFKIGGNRGIGLVKLRRLE